MGEVPGHFLEMTKPPGGVARRTKELLAHIVVDSEYDMTTSIEVLNGFGADQATATGNQYLQLQSPTRIVVPGNVENEFPKGY